MVRKHSGTKTQQATWECQTVPRAKFAVKIRVDVVLGIGFLRGLKDPSL